MKFPNTVSFQSLVLAANVIQLKLNKANNKTDGEFSHSIKKQK